MLGSFAGNGEGGFGWRFGMAIYRVRSSRALEEALTCRIDFRWLAEGHTADHTTLSEFRRKFAEPLKGLFVQIGLLAQERDLTSLGRLVFDGTRMRANNRRNRSRTPAELERAEQAGEGPPKRVPLTTPESTSNPTTSKPRCPTRTGRPTSGTSPQFSAACCCWSS